MIPYSNIIHFDKWDLTTPETLDVYYERELFIGGNKPNYIKTIANRYRIYKGEEEFLFEEQFYVIDINDENTLLIPSLNDYQSITETLKLMAKEQF